MQPVVANEENVNTLFAGISTEQTQQIMNIPHVAAALEAIEQAPNNRQNWNKLITALGRLDGMPASVIAHAEKWAGEYHHGYVAPFREVDCPVHHHTL